MHYVALDIGNVLCRINFSKFALEVSKQLDIPIDEAKLRLNLYQKQQDVGLLSMRDILRLEFGIKSNANINKLFNVWINKVNIFDSSVINFFESLNKEIDLKIAILSNIGSDHAKIVDSYFNTVPGGAFNNCIRYFSYKIGVRKPQSLYYCFFLQQHPEFKNCIYLDDILDNVESSKECGLRGLEFNLNKFKNDTDVLQALQNVKQKIIEGNV